MSVDLLSVAVNLCGHLVQCDAVDLTMLSRQPMAALQDQIKALWREVGMCPDDRGVAQRPPAPVLSSRRLATFMCPLLKGGNVFHLLFKVENTAPLQQRRGFSVCQDASKCQRVMLLHHRVCRLSLNTSLTQHGFETSC